MCQPDQSVRAVMKISKALLILGLGLFGIALTTPEAYGQDANPSILIVTAHPDDEALFAGTIYRAAVELGARVELALVTDGVGGYRFSTLAESIYGLELSDPAVARQYLPAIRKRELMAGGEIVGIRDYHFLDQPDSGYTQDPDSILSYVWRGDFVTEQLKLIMEQGDFDIVLTHLPRENTHGHHKSASILAIKASEMLTGRRPVVLGSWIASGNNEAMPTFDGLDGYPQTETDQRSHRWSFDRTTGLGLDGRLNYKIIVNWLIAEHKSQGTMQQLMDRGDYELFWLYKSNPSDGLDRANRFFDWLAHSNQ